MALRDIRVTKYIKERAPFARPILTKLRSEIRKAGPALEETIKWGMPAFLHQRKIVCGFAGFKAHCALWFWRGNVIVGKSPSGGMGQFGRITSTRELPTSPKLRGYVRKAMKHIEAHRGAGK